MAYDYNAARPRAKVKRTGEPAQKPIPDTKPEKPVKTKKQSNQPIFNREKEINSMQNEKFAPFDDEYDENTDLPFINYKKSK